MLNRLGKNIRGEYNRSEANFLKGIFGVVYQRKGGRSNQNFKSNVTANHLKIKDLLTVEITEKPENISGFSVVPRAGVEPASP